MPSSSFHLVLIDLKRQQSGLTAFRRQDSSQLKSSDLCRKVNGEVLKIRHCRIGYTDRASLGRLDLCPYHGDSATSGCRPSIRMLQRT